MKTSITIFIFLLQPLFISAFAMSETKIPADSISEGKVFILNDDSEIIGKILSQTKDSINIITESEITIQIPINSISKIYDHNYFAKNIIYLDAASLLFVGYVNINYDYMLNINSSIRFGAGIGYLFEWEGPSHNYQGFSLMYNFLPGKNNSKFELGFGASYIKEEIEYYRSEYKSRFSVAITIGYRYQNRIEGMLFRIGASYLGYIGGLNLSLGYSFP